MAPTGNGVDRIVFLRFFLLDAAKTSPQTQNIYILLDVLLCSIAEYFYELCRILASP